MNSHRYHPEAESELLDQVAYYEAKAAGLGARFLNEVQFALGRACTLPKLGSPYFSGTRRVFPKGFGFSIVYRESKSELYVVAVASFSRRPGYWRKRKSES